MRILYTLLIFFSLGLSVILGQNPVPKGMSYQAVVRNSSGNLVANAPVGIRISIIQTEPGNDPVFSETHLITTNANGLATLRIGSGQAVAGNLNDIDWSLGPFFLRTETDPTGGTNYSIVGTSQFLSVPYTLYAERACNATAGPPGPQGPQGVAGPAGLYGKTILNGTSNPGPSQGTAGDFFLNTTTQTLFGPKVGNNWGSGVILKGNDGILPNGSVNGVTPYWNGQNWIVNSTNLTTAAE
jgi:hypothetical protein